MFCALLVKLLVLGLIGFPIGIIVIKQTGLISSGLPHENSFLLEAKTSYSTTIQNPGKPMHAGLIPLAQMSLPMVEEESAAVQGQNALALTRTVNLCYDYDNAERSKPQYTNPYYRCRAQGLKDSPTWAVVVHEGATSWCTLGLLEGSVIIIRTLFNVIKTAISLYFYPMTSTHQSLIQYDTNTFLTAFIWPFIYISAQSFWFLVLSTLVPAVIRYIIWCITGHLLWDDSDRYRSVNIAKEDEAVVSSEDVIDTEGDALED